jgi:hypothetical protein
LTRSPHEDETGRARLAIAAVARATDATTDEEIPERGGGRTATVERLKMNPATGTAAPSSSESPAGGLTCSVAPASTKSRD